VSSYLAIDIGTSSAKAGLYSQEGRLLASKSQDYPLLHPKENWSEQNPEDWWQAVQRICKQLTAENPRQAIRAICVSGQAPSCAPVDRKGRPVRPAILWLDRRATRQVEWLRERLGQAVERLSGNTLDSYFGGPKWCWYLQEEPERYQKTWKILQANSTIIQALTGEAVTDPSHAGLCSPCFELDTGQWNLKVCRAMGIEAEKLPAIHPAGQVVGMITPEAANATGIPAKTPAVCGAGDFACACLGAGVIEAGQAAAMLGTAGNLMLPGIRRPDARLLNTKHATGAPLSLGGVMAGGVVSWFVGAFGGNTPGIYDLLEEEARQTPPGAQGLIFLPYLMGERTPVWDPQARGVFFGLSATHRRGHLYRAVLEGVAYAFRQIMEITCDPEHPISEVVFINGGARNALWRQIFADVLSVTVRWLPNSGGTTLGGAYLAALGCGDVSGFTDIRSWLEPSIDTRPNPDNRAVYSRQYPVYQELYPRLKECFSVLRAESDLTK
jgi:sugar (pentulose or hexulose) kinase